MGFLINFGETEKFTPFEGSGADLLPFEGIVECVIEKVTSGESRQNNKMLIFTLVVKDDDAKGMRVVKRQPVAGTRSDGIPNVHGLLEILNSAWSADGLDDAQIKAKRDGLSGSEIDDVQIGQQLTGKTVYADVSSRQYQNNSGAQVWTSEVRNFKLKRHVEDAKPVGAHRRPLPPAPQAYLDGARSGNVGGSAVSASAPAAAPAVSGAKASDIV